MDLAERIRLQGEDFFQQSAEPHRIDLKHTELDDHNLQSSLFDFNLEQSIDPYLNLRQLQPLKQLNDDDCRSIRQNNFQDTNHHQIFLEEEVGVKQNKHSTAIFDLSNGFHNHESVNLQCQQLHPILSQTQLKYIITFLVQQPNLSNEQLQKRVEFQFPELKNVQIVKTLTEKFRNVKKTKEQLIKYCMRKAFKFILDLPKNQHLLINSESTQKHSTSKSKSRYFKKISEEKSMNNKFLNQVFSQPDFVVDYILFLEQFETIIREDNEKKIAYLTNMLAKEGKLKNVQMVKRLPWTNTILDKVLKLARQLLKFSSAEIMG